MSNYSSPTRHPVTGAIEMADWLDDHDGKHRYGVRFPSDGKIYGSRECFECTWPELLAEIARLRAALGKVMQKCPYARKDQWCAGLDCTCVIIRAALEGGKTND
jgi:hypothetical protein